MVLEEFPAINPQGQETGSGSQLNQKGKERYVQIGTIIVLILVPVFALFFKTIFLSLSIKSPSDPPNRTTDLVLDHAPNAIPRSRDDFGNSPGKNLYRPNMPDYSPAEAQSGYEAHYDYEGYYSSISNHKSHVYVLEPGRRLKLITDR